MSGQALPVSIRAARAEDVPVMLAFIHELALYEREPDAVRATEADLVRDGFSDAPRRFRCLMAEVAGEAVGFALFFYNYSTWRGRAGIHIEDLYVRPERRGLGTGKALLRAVARIAVEEGCERLEWSVLTWNEPAIGFYERMGAVGMTEWRTMRVAGDALAQLGSVDQIPSSS